MNRSADVIVVGAGVVGVAVAYELARRGARVRVFDARGTGQGATQASAGMLAPYTEVHAADSLRHLAIRGLDLYDRFVDGIRARADVPFEYARCGSLQVAANETQMEDLRQMARELGRSGVACEVLTGPAVRELEPKIQEDVAGGLLVPSQGYVAAGDLTRAMFAAGSAAGMRVEIERVLRISAQPAGLSVETPGETSRAPVVIVAAGSWTARVAVEGDRPLPVRPVRGQLVQLDWPMPPLGRIVWGADCYLVPWSSGAVLVGATMEEAGFDERATAAGVRDLLDSACDMLPLAWQAAFAGVRVGLRPATVDGLPIIGPSPAVPGVYYATGHFRNGVLLAPVTAVLMADLVLNGTSDPALLPFDPGRFAR